MNPLNEFDAWEVRGPGTAYLINDSGEIIRLDMPFTASGQWCIRAIEKATGGRLARFKSSWVEGLAELAKGGPTTFKNGRPLFYLGDWDHGSARTQMSGVTAVERSRWRKNSDCRYACIGKAHVQVPPYVDTTPPQIKAARAAHNAEVEAREADVETVRLILEALQTQVKNPLPVKLAAEAFERIISDPDS